MQVITSPEEIKNMKSRDFIEFKCEYCNNSFKRIKKIYSEVLTGKSSQTLQYCSHECSSKSKINQIKCNCKECNKELIRNYSGFINFTNHFCNHSCAAKFGNRNKTTGYRRSKLELSLEAKLKDKYQFYKIFFLK